jgi:hypothetical protein
LLVEGLCVGRDGLDDVSLGELVHLPPLHEGVSRSWER